MIKECLIYDKGMYEAMERKRNNELTVGKVELNKDEHAILSLNPKYQSSNY